MTTPSALFRLVVAAPLTLAAALAVGPSPAWAQGSAPVTIVGPMPVPVAGTVNVSGPLSVNGTVTSRDADLAARSPFQVTLCSSASFGNATGTPCGDLPFRFTAPSNRRTVIEYVSGECGVSGDVNLLRFSLATTAGGTSAAHRLHLERDPLDSRFYDINHLTRIYADAGTVFGLNSSSGGGAGAGSYRCIFTLSGHTVAM